MSLINDALKKAERMRREQAGSPPEASEPATGRQAARKRPSIPLTIGIVAGAATLVCLSVFLTLRIARKPVTSISLPTSSHAIEAEDSPSVVSAKPLPSAAPLLIASNPGAAAPVPTHTSGSSTPRITLPASALPAAHSTPAPQVTAILPAPVSAQAAPSTASGSPEISLVGISGPGTGTAITPGQGAIASPAAQAVVNNLKIMGIRASGKESRVLINDRVYRVNDLVDSGLGLRLVEVSNDRLVFVDGNGARYFRNF